MKKVENKTKISRRKKTTFADGGGLRFNAQKTLIELVPPEWIWGLADVTTRGSIVGGGQYPMRNWERGMKWSICIGCALRHIMKFLFGERYDPETGCHHMFMAAWNCCALATYDLTEIGEDDLPSRNVELLARINSGVGTNYAKKSSTAGKIRPRRRR